MMQRSSVLAVALTLVVAFAAPVAAGSLGFPSAPSDSATAQAGTAFTVAQENNSTDNDSVQPGEKLAGVVSVQGAEVSGEVEERTFGHRIAAANSDRSKAAVIASESSSLEERLSEIKSQQETLKEKHENGTISKGQYKARTAKLVAEARTIQRLLNTTASSAETLPSATLEDNGVSVQSINNLQQSAKNLTGPEVSEMAKEIAGNDVGKTPPGLSNETPGNGSAGVPGNGPGDAPGNGSGGAPGNGASGNGTPGNGSAGTPGNGTPGNGTPGNGSVGTPGNGSVGTPGNGTPGSGTPGNGAPGNGSNGLPGNSTNVSTPGNSPNVSNPSNSTITSVSDNSTITSDSGNSSNVHLDILSALTVELDDSIVSVLDHF